MYFMSMLKTIDLDLYRKERDMNYGLILKPVLSVTVLTYALSSEAARPINVEKTPFDALNQRFFIAALGQHQSSPLAQNTLKEHAIRHDEQGMSHRRLQQYFEGFLVFGGYAILHQNQSQSAHNSQAAQGFLTGRIFDALSEDLGPVPSDLKSNESSALDHFLKAYQGLNLSHPAIKPIIYIDASDKAHWAYQVSVTVRPADDRPIKPSAIIDAANFTPFISWDEIKTNRVAVKGTGYGGNVKTGLLQHGVHTPMLSLTREEQSGLCYMENRQVKVVDMAGAYDKQGTPMNFLCANRVLNTKDTYWTGYRSDGYDMANGAYSVSNDVMYAGAVIKKLYKDWYGLDVLKTATGQSMQLVMRVHYGVNYENAFWDGQQMSFGDGANGMYPLVSLDISTHEVSHGFTEQHSNLHYSGQSGGINEAFSDMAAQAAEYFVKGSNSWQIGADISKSSGALAALRYMDKPSRDGHSIDLATSYKNGMDVHYSSGVYNRLFYLLANQAGWDTRKAFAVMLKANMDYWTPYSGFEQAACGVLNAAYALNYPLADVYAALDAVAINSTSCGVF